MEKDKNENKADELSFEEAYKALEETLSAMEEEDVSLEDSLKLFERGVTLYKRCRFLIESASLSVKEVIGELEKEMDIYGNGQDLED